MIRVHNDGKEKSFSFDASIEVDDLGCAFGATEEEAIRILKEMVEGQIKRLQEIDYTKITYVDCLGLPIKPGGS